MSPKMTMLIALFLLAGCGGGWSGPGSLEHALFKNDSVPEVSASELSLLSSESDLLASSHRIQWVYYVDPGQISLDSRWYISQATSSAKTDVYSLMAIRNGDAGWGTVAENAARVDLRSDLIVIDGGLDRDTSECYEDAGWRTTACDPQILIDRARIQGSTVADRWGFFRAPDREGGTWYIVLAEAYAQELDVPGKAEVRRFSSKDGEYDWPVVDLAGYVAEFSTSADAKHVSFVRGGSSEASVFAWKCPLPRGTWRVTQGVGGNGAPDDSHTDGYNLHWGLDLVPEGQRGDVPVYAMHRGRFTTATTKENGNHVRIQHLDAQDVASGIETVYAHLADGFDDDLESGEIYEEGTLLGYMGNTGEWKGNPVGRHLHISVKYYGDSYRRTSFIAEHVRIEGQRMDSYRTTITSTR